MWYNIDERGKGQTQLRQEHRHLIPICTLAPTVPRTLVCGVGWKAYSSEVKSVDLDGEVEPE
jgi:protein arginine N-methyltransferase 2